jgi:hypothetical protein
MYIKTTFKNGDVVEIGEKQTNQTEINLTDVISEVTAEDASKASGILARWRNQQKKEPRNYGRKERKIGRFCVICGSRLPKHQVKYCSPLCVKKGARKAAKRYYRRKKAVKQMRKTGLQ